MSENTETKEVKDKDEYEVSWKSAGAAYKKAKENGQYIVSPDLKKVDRFLVPVHEIMFLSTAVTETKNGKYTNVDCEDFYQIFQNKKWMLKFDALSRIASRAGINFDIHETKLIENSPEFVIYQAVARRQEADGTWREIKKGKTFDLNQLREDKTANDFKKFYPHRVERCEAAAKARVIREFMGLPNSFVSPSVFDKGLLIIKFILNTAHPAIEKLKLEAMAQSMGLIYGAGAGNAQQTPQLEQAPKQIESHTQVEKADYTHDESDYEPYE